MSSPPLRTTSNVEYRRDAITGEHLSLVVSIEDLRLAIRVRPSDDGILTAASSPSDHLAAHRRVFELCWSKHIIGLALSSLVIGTEAPAERLILTIDDDVMISSSGRKSSSSDVRHGKGYQLSSPITAIIESDVPVGES